MTPFDVWSVEQAQKIVLSLRSIHPDLRVLSNEEYMQTQSYADAVAYVCGVLHLANGWQQPRESN